MVFLLCEGILCIDLLFANFSSVAISSLGARSANAAGRHPVEHVDRGA